MYIGTQVAARDDGDFQVWAQLGVKHVCADPAGNPHHWSLDDLMRHREKVEGFGLVLDMVQLPMSSRPVEEQHSRSILLGKSPERDRELALAEAIMAGEVADEVVAPPASPEPEAAAPLEDTAPDVESALEREARLAEQARSQSDRLTEDDVRRVREVDPEY